MKIKQQIKMSETASSEATKAEAEQPVSEKLVFPPFPAPKDEDFDDDISEEERKYYLETFPDINKVTAMRLHCTACDRHLGSSARSETRMRCHPMLRTLMCNTCHSFYNSGEFDKGEDGSELYCRWCGQGGQVYCCSDCPVVFCAKCIKRNLGVPKIKEIENTDDWKCFKCNSECLWSLRATCWALLRYCGLKNKIAYSTQDPDLREAYIKECSQDLTECCKNKIKKKAIDTKKKETDAKETSRKSTTPSPAPKLPPTIQVKKFASISNEERGKDTKKAMKRPASPKNKIFLKSPITVSPAAKIVTPVSIGPPPLKKIRMGSQQAINPIRIQSVSGTRTPTVGFTRIRPKPPQPQPLILNQFNGYNNATFGNALFTNTSNLYNNDANINDNINLSLENLTQGLDVGGLGLGSANKDDVVCTPDFPLEPLCEVTEENDDDVQCITPAPVTHPKPHALPTLTSDNIVQMTENDVTVNPATGGLKFRVDPQTLSSNKMYRLPDGRIFAINANPNMPGGYSATIVAITDTTGKITPKTGVYAAKLSAVPSPKTYTNTSINSSKNNKNNQNKQRLSKLRGKGVSNNMSYEKETEKTEKNNSRQCDLKVPVEWYRYNLIDAVDALEYSLSRLHKLKNEATTVYLRTRSVAEMRVLHKKLDRLLNTSSTRFNEIKSHLNTEMKNYLQKKMATANNDISDDDDDDVEILNDSGDADDPIFIDENSMDGTSNDGIAHESQVDLTTTNEHNDSEEKSEECSSQLNKKPSDSCEETNVTEKDTYNKSESHNDEYITSDLETVKDSETVQKNINEKSEKPLDGDIADNQIENGPNASSEKSDILNENVYDDKNDKSLENILNDTDVKAESDKFFDKDKEDSSKTAHDEKSKIYDNEEESRDRDEHENEDVEMSEDKGQDIDMSEELIETLLQDDSVTGDFENDQSSKTDITEDIQEP